MRTLVLDPAPAQLQQLLDHRRQTGVDRHDEVWEGVHHMVPAPSAAHSLIAQQLAVLLDAPARDAGALVSADFNLGVEDDFRVPDLGVHRDRPHGTWVPTAAAVIEILSPRDETWDKLPFYVRHGVQEVIIVDAEARSVTWLALREGEYQHVERSEILDLDPGRLAERIDWPPVD